MTGRDGQMPRRLIFFKDALGIEPQDSQVRIPPGKNSAKAHARRSNIPMILTGAPQRGTNWMKIFFLKPLTTGNIQKLQ